MRLSHVSIARQLVPSYEVVQAQLNDAVAGGNLRLVSKVLETCDGFPDMDIAAKADQFVMLKMLDSMEKAGSCVCQSTNKMAVYAATNCNLAMLEWLLLTRLEVNGEGVLEAAAGVGCIVLIIWILDQADKFRIVNLWYEEFHSHEGVSISAMCKALQCGHVDIAAVIVEYFGLHYEACKEVVRHASTLPAIQQFLFAFYDKRHGRLEDQRLSISEFWVERIEDALRCGDAETLQTVLDIMQKITGAGFPELKPYTRSLPKNFIVPSPWRPISNSAAWYGDVRVLQLLSARMANHQKKMDFSSEAIAVPAVKGNFEVVRTFSEH